MASEGSTTPDLVELIRGVFDAVSGHELDLLMGFYAPDAVYDASHAGLGSILEGVAEIREFAAEWWASFEDHQAEVLEMADLGHGVAFARVRESGRPLGGDGWVEQVRGWVVLWAGALIERQTPYLDPDEARAAAERLAKERG